ncbi:hypothetical protein R1flu_009585 [Riccia fluitans]|uniref:Uncharacterized protein n=1 Tax=Riccia fluitans TaxID=41844 RepID=A0ABD1Z2J0_9MARC
MPIQNILKGALLEVDSAARRFHPEQSDIWEKNRETILNWIRSADRPLTRSSLITSNSRGAHFNGGFNQEFSLLEFYSQHSNVESTEENEPATLPPIFADQVDTLIPPMTAPHAIVSENARISLESRAETRRQNNECVGAGRSPNFGPNWWGSFRPP